MSDENEVTGFVSFKKIKLKRSIAHGPGMGSSGPTEVSLDGEFREDRNDLDHKGKVVITYPGVASDPGSAWVTGSSIPDYALRAIQKEMAYLADELRSRFDDFNAAGQGVFEMLGTFTLEFRIDATFEIKMVPRKISGDSNPPENSSETDTEPNSGDQNDDRWAIE